MAALGRPGYINLGHATDLPSGYDVAGMQSNAMQVLNTAYARGVRYFDVARSYGRGEQFLAEWLNRHRQRKDILIGSKWGYTYTAGWQVEAEKHEVKEHSVEVLNRQWPESRQLLGKWLGIYHIHSATLESGVLENPKVLDKLWDLKDSGMVVGLSLSGEKQAETLDKALTIRRADERLFQSVQATWNILEQSATASLKKSAKEGMGIIIKEALANGRLSDRNREPHFMYKRKVLQAMAEKYEVGMDAISIAFVLRQAWVHTVLSGAGNEAQLLSNLKAEHVQLSEEDANTLGNLMETGKEYWKIRAGLPWN